MHVLLSMRDDFLFHCHRFASLTPVFSALTPLGPPTGAALRRALVQPALKCGYRFEDESLVDEMLAQVAGERGALPLLAFTAARLWERRDRERGLLTRAAYDEIGGVSARSPSTPRRRSSASARNACRSCASCSATWSQPRARAPRSTARSCCRSSARRRSPAGRATPGRAARRRRPCSTRSWTPACSPRTSAPPTSAAARAGVGSRSCTSRCSRRGRAWSLASRRPTPWSARPASTSRRLRRGAPGQVVGLQRRVRRLHRAAS